MLIFFFLLQQIKNMLSSKKTKNYIFKKIHAIIVIVLY